MNLKEQLERAKTELEELRAAYKRTLAAQSWNTKDGESSRSVTNVSLSVLSDEIRKKEVEVRALEDRAAGRTSSAFRGRMIW